MNQLLIALRVEHNKAALRSCSVVEGWAAVARLPIVDMSSFSFFWQQISRVNQQRLCWLQPTSALRSATIVLRGYASLLWIRKALWPKFSWQISSCSISIYMEFSNKNYDYFLKLIVNTFLLVWWTKFTEMVLVHWTHTYALQISSKAIVFLTHI